MMWLTQLEFVLLFLRIRMIPKYVISSGKEYECEVIDSYGKYYDVKLVGEETYFIKVDERYIKNGKLK